MSSPPTASGTSRAAGGGRVGTAVRTCIGCRRQDRADQLLRLVADHERRTALVDLERRRPGRGANLHPTLECYQQAVRRRAFARALRVDGPIDTGAIEEHIASHTVPAPPTDTNDRPKG